MGLASAYDDIGYYKLNTDMNINLGCSYNNTYCARTFICNITIYNKNGILVNNIQMGNDSYPQYNYTIKNNVLNTTGLYYGRQVCCNGGLCGDYSFSFNVNAMGKDATGNTIIYAILLTTLILLFIGSLIAFLKIEYKNYKNEEGTLYKINWQKYLKMFMFAMSYLIFLSITYLAWVISYGVLEFSQMAGIFNALYNITFIVMFPIFSATIIIGAVSFLQDKKLETLIQRGLTIR